MGSAIASVNGLSPVRCKAIARTNADLMSIGPSATSEILFEMENFI